MKTEERIEEEIDEVASRLFKIGQNLDYATTIDAYEETSKLYGNLAKLLKKLEKLKVKRNPNRHSTHLSGCIFNKKLEEKINI